MTDQLTPAMRVEVLELILNYRNTSANTLVRCITELRDEAARREAEGLPPPKEVIVKDRTTGAWKHYGQAVGTGEETSPAYGLDAPPPPAPKQPYFKDMVFALKVASTEDEWHQQKTKLLDAIEALRAERDALRDVLKTTEGCERQASNRADWSFVREAIMDAVANGEGELYEKYLRMAFAKHGLAVIEIPPCS